MHYIWFLFTHQTTGFGSSKIDFAVSGGQRPFFYRLSLVNFSCQLKGPLDFFDFTCHSLLMFLV